MGFFFSKQSTNVKEIYPPTGKTNFIDYLCQKLYYNHRTTISIYQPINDMASDITDFSDLMNDNLSDEAEEIDFNLEAFFD